MCTSLFKSFANHSYFGRNLDLAYPLESNACLIKETFPLDFKCVETLNSHHAILGIGVIYENTPLLFEGINDHGLGVASLNFPRNAKFNSPKEDKLNLAPYEIVSYLLAKYTSVKDLMKDINNLNIVNIPFNERLPLAELHYLIADKEASIVVEQDKDGLKIYPNEFKVLTNNPPFSYHLENIVNYMGLSSNQIDNRLSDKFTLIPHSLGMGSLFLPGDVSSPSRFIRMCFETLNISSPLNISSEIKEYFNLLEKVKIIKGEAKDKNNDEFTVYSSCYDVDTFELFYRTYDSNEYYKFNVKEKDDLLIYHPLKQEITFIEDC